MSYCRKSWNSDVYAIGTGNGYECLCCCLLNDPYESLIFKDADGLYHHLLDHVSNGHRVPLHVLERLKAQIDGVPYTYPPTEEEIVGGMIWRLSAPQRVLKRTNQISDQDLFRFKSGHELLKFLEETYERCPSFAAAVEIRAVREFLQEHVKIRLRSNKTLT